MEKQTLTIPNISCGHCVMTIKNELSELTGVSAVAGNPADKSITIEWDAPATLAEIRNILSKLNYPAS